MTLAGGTESKTEPLLLRRSRYSHSTHFVVNFEKKVVRQPYSQGSDVVTRFRERTTDGDLLVFTPPFGAPAIRERAMLFRARNKVGLFDVTFSADVQAGGQTCLSQAFQSELSPACFAFDSGAPMEAFNALNPTMDHTFRMLYSYG